MLQIIVNKNNPLETEKGSNKILLYVRMGLTVSLRRYYPVQVLGV
jgi:hypothetical protein